MEYTAASKARRRIEVARAKAAAFRKRTEVLEEVLPKSRVKPRPQPPGQTSLRVASRNLTDSLHRPRHASDGITHDRVEGFRHIRKRLGHIRVALEVIGDQPDRPTLASVEEVAGIGFSSGRRHNLHKGKQLQAFRLAWPEKVKAAVLHRVDELHDCALERHASRAHDLFHALVKDALYVPALVSFQ